MSEESWGEGEGLGGKGPSEAHPGAAPGRGGRYIVTTAA